MKIIKYIKISAIFGTVLLFIFMFWLFAPMVISVNSVGKEFFLVDKTNINIYLKSRLLSTFKGLDLVNEIGEIKSAILNESRNKNDGEMAVYDPSLKVETESERLFLDKPHQIAKKIAKHIETSNALKNTNFSTNTGGIENLRYFKTFPSNKHNFSQNIKLSGLIDSSQFNGKSILNENPIQSSPIYHNGILYFVTRENSFLAWNIDDSKVIFNLKFVKPPAQRGFALHQDIATNETTLYFIVSTYLVAVDASNGNFKEDFGTNGYHKVGFGTSSPIVFGDIVLASTNMPPAIHGINRYTGEEIWKKSIDGGSSWGGMSLDKNKGLLFISTGNPKPPLYGGNRMNTNKEANSLIALNAYNGEVLWSYQDVIHDLWDFDIASPPTLLNLKDNKILSEVVIVPSKRGNLIVADRETGKLLQEPIQVSTPISDVAGEKTSPYQPLINFPEPFMDHAFYKDHLREDLKFKKIFDLNDYKFGFFEPPSLKKTLIVYGLHGGATWTGLSVDTRSNQLFVAVNKVPWKLRLFLQNSNPKESLSEHKGKNYYVHDCSSCHGDKRNGSYKTLNELEHNIVPSLVGVQSTSAIDALKDFDVFKEKHDENFQSYSLDQLNEITEYFQLEDKLLYKNNSIKLHYLWSMFIDENGLPINKPPYGEVVAYDLDTFKVNWKIPVGDYHQYNGSHPTGQFIYGGMATTSDGVLFVTGGPDRFIRAFNTDNGELIWDYKMEAAGSAPPIVFQHNNVNYLAVVSTGGKFPGFDKKSSNLYLFRF